MLPNGQEQIERIVRFGDVFFGTLLHTPELVAVFRFRGQQNNRSVLVGWVFLEGAANMEDILTRHDDIENNQVKIARLCRCLSFNPITR